RGHVRADRVRGDGVGQDDELATRAATLTRERTVELFLSSFSRLYLLATRPGRDDLVRPDHAWLVQGKVEARNSCAQRLVPLWERSKIQTLLWRMKNAP